MEQFTFYELYADILQGTDDVSAGKLASNICAYEFEDREPDGEMTDKEHFYWSNIADILHDYRINGKKDTFITLEPHLQTFAGLNALVGKSFENPYKYENQEEAFADAVRCLRGLL